VQLVEQIKHAIENCTLGPGDQLPGIRALAQEILVSPNTVIKAYSELEREEVIEVRHRSGAFVVASERRKNNRASQSTVRDFVERLRRRGITDGEIRRCVEAELNIENQEARRGR